MAQTLLRASAQPLIAVNDVRASSRWYQQLLDAGGLPGGSDHDHLYDRIYSGNKLILQLHAWDEEDHPNLTNSAAASKGHGVLIWFEVNDFDAAVRRIREMNAEIVREPLVEHGANHRQIWIRDPDGYFVVLASPDGEANQ